MPQLFFYFGKCAYLPLFLIVFKILDCKLILLSVHWEYTSVLAFNIVCHEFNCRHTLLSLCLYGIFFGILLYDVISELSLYLCFLRFTGLPKLKHSRSFPVLVTCFSLIFFWIYFSESLVGFILDAIPFSMLSSRSSGLLRCCFSLCCIPGSL